MRKVMIPSVVRQGVMEDFKSTEALIYLFAAYLLGNRFLSNKVHSSLNPVLLLFVVAIAAYMMLPSSVNYGSNGFKRILIWIRYTLYRLERWWSHL